MTIIKYDKSHKAIWNSFIRNSRLPVFMFERDYMDYHSDRFEDHSLMFFDDDELIAVLPLNIKENELFSHGGLTFGGFVTNHKVRQTTMIEMFKTLIKYCNENSIFKISYKKAPFIYGLSCNEEDLYAMFFLLKDKISYKMEVSSSIFLPNRPKITNKGRKAQIARAKREGVDIVKSNDFCAFIELENEVLKKYHNTKAVHSGKELEFLASNFKENIHLYTAVLNNEMIAGAVIYEYPQMVHTQYLAANDTARQIGALDLLLNDLIELYSTNKLYFDFGKSTENDGLFLNEGLITQKERFGGRSVIYTTYEIAVPSAEELFERE